MREVKLQCRLPVILTPPTSLSGVPTARFCPDTSIGGLLLNRAFVLSVLIRGFGQRASFDAFLQIITLPALLGKDLRPEAGSLLLDATR